MTTPWAVITGATGGLGTGFARRLAADGLPVLLVGRRGDALASLADDLRRTSPVSVETVTCDLADSRQVDSLVADLTTRPVQFLVNNAGFGTVADFVDIPPHRIEQEITLNCLTLTRLARAVAPQMVERHHGTIVNVASTAAYQPIPSMAVYAATKSFVLSLSQALWYELRPHGVSVLGMCPGATETGFFTAAGNDKVLTHRRQVDDVIATCFAALAAGRPSVVDGRANALLAAVSKLAPARVAVTLAKRVVAPH